MRMCSFLCYVFSQILLLPDVLLLFCVIFTEFHSNGNWECSVPVHPGLPLHKSQPDYGHAEKHHLHTTGA